MNQINRTDFRVKSIPRGFVVEKRYVLSRWYWLILKFNRVEWRACKEFNKNFVSIRHDLFKIKVFSSFDAALDFIDLEVHKANNPFTEEVFYPK